MDNVENYKTMNVEQAKNSETAKFLLASVRIEEKNLLTNLNKYFDLDRKFYYGKILYIDKKKYTIRVIGDLDKTTMNSQITFTAYKKDVTVIDVSQIPIAEVYKDIRKFYDLVKVPNNNYGRAEEFIGIVGNTVTFKTDQGTFDTANIMDTLVVHGQTKYLFIESSFLYKWWEKNKKDLMDKKIQMMEKARLAALAAEERRKQREEEASNRALEHLAELAEQKEAEEAERAKQQAAEEERRKAEEAKINRLKNKRKKTQKKEPQRQSRRLQNIEKKKRRDLAKKKLPEEYTEKLKF